MICILIFANVTQAFANPQGGVVTSGSATITTNGPKTDIHQSTNKAVIDWRSFDIAPGETTQFYQPSTKSMTLNRVNSGNASQIMGNLKANGNIVILNSSGVMFGAGSNVDVGGLVATTTGISNQKFMKNGKLHFDQAGDANAKIINEGTITAKSAGLVGLVAPHVENNGVITAHLGKASLASADDFTMDMYGDGLMNFKASDNIKKQIVSNKGTIDAAGGTIALTAAAGREVVDSLITVSGELKAPAVGVKNGKISIFAEGANAVVGNKASDKGQKQGASAIIVDNAKIDVTGDKGGAVEIIADNVLVKQGTAIDASGKNGGGTVKIGGAYQGKGTTATAQNVFVEKNTSVKVDAIEKGNGGEAIIWADNSTNFYGDITAKGGAQSGNGGFVEVSGKEYLNYRGFVDTTAENGETGLLLLDPTDIIIANGTFDSAADGTGTFAGTPSGVAGTIALADTGPSTIYESELQGIASTTNISLQASNSITLQDLADNNLSLAQTAGRTVTFTADTFTMADTNDTISVNGGALSFNVTNGTFGNLATNGGLITMNIAGTATAQGVISGTGTALTKTGLGELILNGANTHTGISLLNRGTITIGNNAAFGTGQLSWATAQPVTLQTNGTAKTIANSINSTITGTGITFAGTADLTFTGAMSNPTGSATMTYTFTNTGLTTFSGNFSIGNSRNLVLAGSGNSLFSGILSGTSATLTKGGTGTLTLSGANTYDGLTSVTGGTLRYGASDVIATGGLSVTSATLDLGTYSDTVGSFTLSGGTYTSTTGILSSTGNFNVLAGTISGILGGNSTLVKTTGGTVTITSANTFNGGTTNTSGFLYLENGSALGTGLITMNGGNIHFNTNPMTVNNGFAFAANGGLNFNTNTTLAGNISLSTTASGRTITLAGASDVTLSGVISDGVNANNTLISNISGVLTLSGTNTFSNSLALGTNTVIANNSAFGNSTVTLYNGATVAADGTARTIGNNLNIGSSVTVNIAGNSNLTLNGAINGGGGNRIFNITNSGLTTFGGAIDISSNNVARTLTFNGTGAVTFNGVISNGSTSSSSIALNGSNTYTFNGNNTYSGGTTLNTGATARVGHNNGLGTGIISFSGGALQGDGTTRTLANALGFSGATTANISGTSDLVLSGTVAGATLNRTINITNSGLTTFSGAWSVTSNTIGRTMIFDGTGNILLNGDISNGNTGASGISQIGSGTLTIASTNSYTGTTSVSNGTLKLALDNIGGGALVLAGGTLVADGGTRTLSNALTLSASSTIGGSNAFIFNGTMTNINADNTLTINNSAMTTFGAINLTNVGVFRTVTFAGTGNTTMNGVIANGVTTGSFAMSGSGTMTLNAANTYSGSTTVNSGTLKYGINDALFSGAVNVNGGTLDIGSYTDSVGAFTLTSGTLTGTTGVLTGSSYTVNDGTLGAILAGTGTMTKNGATTVLLNKQNTFTGLVTVNAGTLQYGTSDAFSTNAITVAGGTLDMGTYSDTVGAVTLSSGTIASTSGILTGTSYALQSGTVSAILAGTGALTKTTAGSITLSGVNTYTGNTTVSAGTLVLGNSNILDDASTVTVSGGTLDIGNKTDTIANLTITSGTIDGTGTLTVGTAITATAGTINANLAGAAALTNTGILYLNGSNSYSGISTVQGTVYIGHNNAFGSNIVSMGGGGNIRANNGAKTIANNVRFFTGATISGTENLTLSGAITNLTSSTSTLNVTNSGLTTFNELEIASGATAQQVTLANTGNVVVNNIKNGGTATSGDFSKSGAGTLTLSGQSTFSGTLSLVSGAGSLIYGANNALVDTVAISMGNATTLNLGSYSDTVGAITFGNNDGTITSTTGILSAASISGGAGNQTISAILGGTGTVTKTVSGTMYLTRANTYSGGTSATGGTLQISSNSSFGTGAITVSSGIIQGDGVSPYTITNAIANLGTTFRVAGTSALTFTSDINCTFNCGINSTSTGLLTVGNVSIAGSRTATFDGTGDITVSGVISGAGLLTKSGTNTLTLNGNNTFTGLTTINAGTLRYGTNDVLTGSVTLAGGTYDIAGYTDTIGAYTQTGGTLTGTTGVFSATSFSVSDGVINAILGGSGALTKTGTTDLLLSRQHTYTGGTTISGGSLTYNTNNALADAGTISVGSGTTLAMGAFSDTVGAISLGGTISGTSGVLSASSITASNGTQTISAILGGTGSVSKTVSGTLYLTRANTYSGGTNATAGTIQISDNSALGTGAVNFNSGILSGDGTARTIANDLSGGLGGTITFGGTSALTTTGTLSCGFTCAVNSTNTALTTLGNVSIQGSGGSYIMSFGGTGNINIAGIVSNGSGTLGLTKNGTGTLTLSNQNTYGGLTTVNAGTLAYGSNNAIGSGNLTVAGGTVDMGAYTDTVGAVNMTSGTISGTGTLTGTSYTAVQGTISANLAGTGTLTKSTSGTLILTGANTYSGGTTLSGVGIVSLGQNTSLGSGVVTTTGTVSLQGNSTAVTIANNFNLQTSLFTGGSNALTFSGTLTNTSGGGNTIYSTNSALTTFNNLVLSNNATNTVFNFSGTGNIAVTGVISNGGTSTTSSINKDSTGNLTLSGANTYGGSTTVVDGTLDLNGGSAIADTGALIMNGANAKVSLGANETIGSLSGNTGDIQLGSSTLTVSQTGNTTYSGILSGAGSLIKAGAGTLTLAGNNTFTGGLTIAYNGGTLALGANNALADTLDIKMDQNSTFDIGAYSDTVGAISALTGLGTPVVITGTSGVLSASSITFGAGTQTISAILGGTGTLKKYISGTMNLTRANTYSGGTDVTGGTIVISNNSSLGTGSLNLNSGILSGDGLANYTIANAINAGSFNLFLAGNSALTFTGDMSCLGNCGVSSSATALVTVGNVSMAGSGSLFTIGGTGDMLFNGVISGSNGRLTMSGSGTATLSGANTYNGVTTVNSGTLAYGANNVIASGAIDISGGTLDMKTYTDTVGAVTLNSGTISGTTGNALTGTSYNVYFGMITANLAGTGAMTKLGGGQTTLTGTNTFTGGTTINAGSLQLNSTGSLLDTGAVVIANNAGATLRLNVNKTIGSLSGGGTTGGTVTLNGVTLTLGGDNTSTSFAGIMSGTGGITKAGSGTFTLTGANTYTGATTVNAGTLAYGANNILADTSNLIVSGGTLAMGNYSDTVGDVTVNSGSISGTGGTLTGSSYTTYFGSISANLAGTGGLSKNGSGQLTLFGTNTYTGTTTINNGTLQLNGGAAISDSSAVVMTHATNAVLKLNTGNETIGSLSGTGLITLAGNTLSVGADNTSTSFTGVASGTGGITKVGSGTWTLSDTQTYTGATTVSGGTLALGSSNVLTDAGSLIVNSGATFDIGTYNDTVNAVTMNGLSTITGSSGVLDVTSSIFVNLGNQEISAILSGAASLIKVGNGTLSLTRANTFTGGVSSYSDTTIQVGNNAALGTGTLLLSNGTLQGDGTARTLANAISLAADATIGGTSTLTMTGLMTNTSGSNATLTVNNSALTTFGAFNLSDSAAARTVTLAGTGNTTFTGVIANGGGSVSGLTKAGTGTLTLSGANTYTGTTTVNNGNLTLAGGSAIADSGAVVMANTSGASLTLAADESIGSLAGGGATGGNVSLGSYRLTLGNDNSSTTYAGIISGTRGITKNGSGVFTLTGANTYTGTTSVSQGTLRIGANDVIADASALSIGVTGTVDLNGYAETFSSVNNTGHVLLAGGTLTTTGSQTHTGTVSSTSASSLTSTGGGSITANNALNDFVGNLTISTTGAVSIADANSLSLGNVSAATLVARALGGNLTLNGQISTSATSGDSLVLTTSGNFINNISNALQTAGTGRWLVYSTSPLTDQRGDLAYAFKQYNSSYGSTVLGSGNGFLYTVAPTLNVSLTGTISKTYDGTTAATLASNNYSISGGIDGDSFDFSVPSSITFDNANAGSGKTVSINGLALNGASNNAGGVTVYGYQLNNTSASGAIGTINKADIRVKANDVSRAYNGTTGVTGGSYSIVSGTLYTNQSNGNAADTLTGGTYAFTDANAGSGNKTVTLSGMTANDGNSGGNYNILYDNNTTSTISKAALTVTVNNVTKTYDGTMDVTGGSYTLTGTLYTNASNGNQQDTLTGGTYAFTNANAGTGNKTVTLSGMTLNDGNSGGNYDVTYTNSTASTINKALLNVTVTAGQAKVYGAADPVSLAYTYTGLVNNETSASFTGGLIRAAGSNVNTYAITQNDLAATGNYAIGSFTAGTFTITPAALTITADALTKVAGAADPALTFTHSGLVNGDNNGIFTGSLTRAGGEAAGSYAISQGSLSAGSNYTITYVGNNLVITNGTTPPPTPNPVDLPNTVVWVSQNPSGDLGGNNSNTSGGNQELAQNGHAEKVNGDDSEGANSDDDSVESQAARSNKKSMHKLDGLLHISPILAKMFKL